MLDKDTVEFLEFVEGYLRSIAIGFIIGGFMALIIFILIVVIAGWG